MFLYICCLELGARDLAVDIVGLPFVSCVACMLQFPSSCLNIPLVHVLAGV